MRFTYNTYDPDFFTVAKQSIHINIAIHSFILYTDFDAMPIVLYNSKSIEHHSKILTYVFQQFFCINPVFSKLRHKNNLFFLYLNFVKQAYD